MVPLHSHPSRPDESSSQAVPILCLLGVVALLSSITPTLKYVLQHSGMTFLSIASGRIVIGFLFLAGITACVDWKGLRALSAVDGARFSVLGLLGVGSYVVAAYGLSYTNVTHYALIYSLLPTFTAFLSWCLAKDRISRSSVIGIMLSWGGCLIALTPNLRSGTWEFAVGDPLVLLFTLMMAAHLVLSMNIVRRHGVLTANTAMFGTSAVLISGCTVAWGDPSPPTDLSWSVWGAVLFIGMGTASVFLLRCRSLQSMPPATVGAYHNLIPVCTIGIAHLSLGEPVTMQTVIGALAVLVGTELVRRKPPLLLSPHAVLARPHTGADSTITGSAAPLLVMARSRGAIPAAAQRWIRQDR
jgi:drug/metabolite transporter (DMT)-like permease